MARYGDREKEEGRPDAEKRKISLGHHVCDLILAHRTPDLAIIPPDLHADWALYRSVSMVTAVPLSKDFRCPGKPTIHP